MAVFQEHILLALAASFGTALVLVPVLSGPAHRFGLVDHPDHRKRHDASTPLTGGLALLGGFIVGLLICDPEWLPIWTLLVGVLVLMVTGLVDDIIDISATARLLIQVGVGALMVYGGGLEIHTLGNLFGPAYGLVGLGPFSAIFTIACVVFMINAINMTDGLDGLAGGVGFVIFLLMALVAWMDGQAAQLMLVALLLALATLGFLVHNMRTPLRQRASAFLGDTGSMVMGFAIAWLAVALGTRAESEIYPISIAWLLIIPGMDTLALFFRRLRMGRSPLSADRAHLHYILRRCGYGVGSTVNVMILLVVGTGMFGILGWQNRWPEWLLFVLATAVLLGYQVVLANAHRILRWHRRR